MAARLPTAHHYCSLEGAPRSYSEATEYHPGTDVEIMPGVATSGFRCAIPNVKRYRKQNRWTGEDVAKAAYEGDLVLLETLLATGDEHNLFNGDLNAHVTTSNPLHMAAMAGQTECVELLLRAKADPHVREVAPYGKDPEDANSALDLARQYGWDDTAELLEQAEKENPYGWYVPAGEKNNAKCYNCWEWGTRPPKDWYFGRPGAARRQGLDPAKYGAPDFEDAPEDEDDFVVSAMAAPPPKVEKPLPVALLFPGQGSQYVKMMSTVMDLPAVKDMLKKANEILGFDILKICLEGPESRLEETSICQPAMFIAGLAGIEKLRSERPEAVTRCQAVAGLSLGEYTALCAAGVFGFEEGLKLVKLRGEAMQDAANLSKQAMLSVAGLDKTQLNDLCAQARATEGVDAVCQIANELFPKGFSCAGTERAILALKELADKAGALQAKVLKTSGGFHTQLMAPAQERLGRALDEALPNLRPPKIAVYMNATATPVRPGCQPSVIVGLLKQQLTSPVLWEPCVRAMIRDGVTEFYEVGPMKQIKAMMKRIDSASWGNTVNVEV